jgi:uncharacterized membrane protein YpjA
MLWALFWVNLLGTIYGYWWYGEQLVFTFDRFPAWYLPFVPDSPTASLFFTLSVGMLLTAEADKLRSSVLGGLIAAFGFVTSLKYGVWAVAMIFAAAAQGDVLQWEDWMLVFSHAGMAVEALLFAGLFRLRPMHFAMVGAWIFANDFMDYHRGIFPWLPRQLLDDLERIEAFTVALSIASLIVIWFVHRWSKIGHPPIR